MKLPRNLLVKRLALASLFGVLVFVILVIILHFLNPQMSPVTVAVSEYVTGHDGFLMTIAFIARGLGELFLIVGLMLGSTRGSRSWTGLVFLTLATVCSFLVAIFPGLVAPFVPGGFQNPGALAIHSLSALLGFSSFALAALFWSARLRKDPRWRSSAPVSFLLGLLVLLSLLGFLAFSKSFLGLAERVLEAFIVCWLGFLAWRLFALSEESTEYAPSPALVVSGKSDESAQEGRA